MQACFHYSFKVKDLESTRIFYKDILGCKEGRSADTWVDFDFFGNQLSAHIGAMPELDYCGQVDGITVPIPHFGVVVAEKEFQQLYEALKGAGARFLIQPQTRYAGKPGEQQTMFVLDFSGNPLEFKLFTKQQEIFLGKKA